MGLHDVLGQKINPEVFPRCGGVQLLRRHFELLLRYPPTACGTAGGEKKKIRLGFFFRVISECTVMADVFRNSCAHPLLALLFCRVFDMSGLAGTAFPLLCKQWDSATHSGEWQGRWHGVPLGEMTAVWAVMHYHM